MGVTSEPATLSREEREGALRAVFEAVGGVPVVVGCSGPSAETVVERVGHARALGAVAAMVSAPPGAQDLDGLPAFFARVPREGQLPLVLQDEPVATGV